jgi:hypothetical protein
MKSLSDPFQLMSSHRLVVVVVVVVVAAAAACGTNMELWTQFFLPSFIHCCVTNE